MEVLFRELTVRVHFPTHDRLRCPDARCNGVVHIVIPEHAGPSSDDEISEPPEISVELLAEFVVPDLEERVCLGNTHNRTVAYLGPADKTEFFEMIHRSRDQILVCLIPGAVV